MIRFKKSKKILAAILTAGMLLAGNGVPICAAEPVSVAQTEEQLNYLVVGSPVVCTPGSQFVLADVGDGTEKLSDAVLTYVNVETGTSYEVTADTVDEGSLLFNMEFDDTQPSGEYEVTTIEVVADGEKRIVRMVDTGIEAKFGINADVDSEADAYVVDEQAEQDAEEACGEDGITVLDAEGQEMTFDSLTEALQEADDSVADSGIETQSTANPNLVVVLDPGHGGSDPGACKYGLREADLTLKIAQYCKSKLEEYSHVEVYMTRTADTDNNLANRVAYAKKFNPDVFVSIHINAVGGQHGGAEVYYPNGNYIPGIGTEGKELAEDPEFQARVASGQVQTLVKNENAAEVKTTKEAKISVAVFLVAMVGIVLLGAVSALVPTLSDGSKLPLTTVIEIFMLVAAAVTVLITKLDSNKVLDQPVFKTGMFAVVLAFGLCWLVNTFIADQSSFITDNMSVLTNEHPWIYIIAVFIVGAITTSQSSSTMIMVPIGIALGLPANIIVAGWIACSSNYFIPASGQCVAAIAFDTAGTTKIGKYVLNHSYMLPGLVCTVVSVVSAILIGAVVF